MAEQSAEKRSKTDPEPVATLQPINGTKQWSRPAPHKFSLRFVDADGSRIGWPSFRVVWGPYLVFADYYICESTPRIAFVVDVRTRKVDTAMTERLWWFINAGQFSAGTSLKRDSHPQRKIKVVALKNGMLYVAVETLFGEFSWDSYYKSDERLSCWYEPVSDTVHVQHASGGVSIFKEKFGFTAKGLRQKWTEIPCGIDEYTDDGWGHYDPDTRIMCYKDANGNPVKVDDDRMHVETMHAPTAGANASDAECVAINVADCKVPEPDAKKKEDLYEFINGEIKYCSIQ